MSVADRRARPLAGGGAGARVLIVEDHELLAQSLSMALGADGYAVVRCDPAEPERILSTVADTSPDVVLLDLDLGDGTTSLPLIEPLAGAGARVVMVTGITDRCRLAECVEAGAVGIVSKSEPFDRLVRAVHTAATGGELLPPAERAALLTDLQAERERTSAFGRLTPREGEVLSALMDGKSAETIAAEEIVSISTVRSHIRSLLSKLGVSSQLAAVAAAQRARWRG